MSSLLRRVEQVVVIERRQWGLCDAETPGALPELAGADIAFGSAGVTVRSSRAWHDAIVDLQLWDGPPPPLPATPLGSGTLRTTSAAVTAWSIPHGPAGDPLVVGEPNTLNIRIHRHEEDPERFTVSLWPHRP